MTSTSRVFQNEHLASELSHIFYLPSKSSDTMWHFIAFVTVASLIGPIAVVGQEGTAALDGEDRQVTDLITNNVTHCHPPTGCPNSSVKASR